MISYRPLWVTLAAREMKKTRLLDEKIISGATLANMGHNTPVSLSTIDKICTYLNCKIEDVVEYRDKRSN